MTGVAPGTEYLLKVNNREVKEGIAESDKVTRKFRMPNLGDKRREARLVMVLANEGCENSPWKLKQKMGYRPPETPPATAEPTPPVTQPQPTPTPPATQTPTTPSVTTPSPKPVTPKLTTPVKPVVPTQPTPVNPLEPAPDAKAWVTPIDPYSRGAEQARSHLFLPTRPTARPSRQTAPQRWSDLLGSSSCSAASLPLRGRGSAAMTTSNCPLC